MRKRFLRSDLHDGGAIAENGISNEIELPFDKSDSQHTPLIVAWGSVNN